MSRLKGGKAPGTCGIRPEVLKAGVEVTIQWLMSLVQYGVGKGCGPQGLERCHNCTSTQERE